ncbi:MAG TPA: AAA family ATPase [Pyrinomonadaceae bacterium]|nr:AAA family ATPase [Pyrinomonadaceae bacterium]
MIRQIQVTNYKSMMDLTFRPARVTVLIGANGSGKSNILEAIALASAASQDKLDNEFLISRGIRVTETRFMRSAFRERPKVPKLVISFPDDKEPKFENVRAPGREIGIAIQGDNEVAFACELWADETGSYPKWRQSPPIRAKELSAGLTSLDLDPNTEVTPEIFEHALARVVERLRDRPVGTLPTFLVYSPEFSALRTFQSEGQILPLGIRGEGLFAHLKALNSENNKTRLAKIKERLQLIDWFETFEIPEDLGSGERSIRIRDRYLRPRALFDQRSANEGFLFLLFYLTLFISPDTPSFFSIDNIDSSLNPKLCIKLVETIVTLAKEYDKQVILTTHNPAVLDGLDLDDEEQSLIVVERSKAGHTRIRPVSPIKTTSAQMEVSLSEAFMRGYIGGLPKNF